MEPAGILYNRQAAIMVDRQVDILSEQILIACNNQVSCYIFVKWK